MTDSSGRGWVLGAMGLGLGLLIGYSVATRDVGPPANPAERELNADLYMQTAAEYVALCEQSYRLAWERVQQKLKEPAKDGLPPAVVLDLDETVLDNSRYQSWLYRHAQKFSPNTWASYEKDHAAEVGLVPGAFDFLQKVEKLRDPSVAVIYISNRRDMAGTLAALKHNRLATPGIEDRIYLRTDGRDKDERRKKVQGKYRVLLYVGDQLGDFPGQFSMKASRDDHKAQTDAMRKQLLEVQRNRQRFGDDWIILPNPVYGDWLDILGNDSAAHLRPAKMRLP